MVQAREPGLQSCVMGSTPAETHDHVPRFATKAARHYKTHPRVLPLFLQVYPEVYDANEAHMWARYKSHGGLAERYTPPGPLTSANPLADPELEARIKYWSKRCGWVGVFSPLPVRNQRGSAVSGRGVGGGKTRACVASSGRLVRCLWAA